MAQLKRMLVPTDFSDASDLALRYAIEMASTTGSTIHLLHVVEDRHLIAAYPDGYLADIPGMLQAMKDEANRLLREAAARCDAAKIPVTTDVVNGRPAMMIVEVAQSHAADVIVMGTHGRSGFAHFFIGSVAERVVRTAPCPVLTVRDTVRSS